ncbi:amidohydrolase family protein [Ningiella sp. W23]|uniref:amidohydrolase family protein n=1 Tax=Ningiella sp. W23 TaxID=3023715 RepID=UPI003756F7B1
MNKLAWFTSLVALIALLSISASVSADDHESKEEKTEEWDVLAPPYPTKSVSISTDETTWSSLDVSPDGSYMVFDMLGDIYKVDIEGGEATPLTQDIAWNLHPTISPDGKHIAFISDRGGLSNIWTMDINGENLTQVSTEKANLIHSPKWSPDGEYIVAMKGIMSRRSIPAGEIWLYHKSGGSGMAIKERVGGKAEQNNIADPAFSHDGRYIYFTQNTVPGTGFLYNRDALEGIFAVTRYDRSTGDEIRFISGTGGSVVPTPSPDGKYVAFIRRVKNDTALFIKDLNSGKETMLTRELERDMQEGFGSEGYYSYYDWTPDSESIVYWASGKIHKLNIESTDSEIIPITVNATLNIADVVRFNVDVSPDEFDVKMIRWSQASPDGKSILFQALGKLYLHDIKSGDVKRLTRQNDHDEYYPRYSHDGKSIVYTTWSDTELGAVRVMSARGGRSKVISQEPGHYIEPSFSTDDEWVTYRKFTGGFLLDPSYSLNPGIYVTHIDDEITRKISDSGVRPHFAESHLSDGSYASKRVFYTEPVSGKPYPETQLVSVNLQGNDKRTHLYGADKVSEYRISPDGKYVAFVHQFDTYLAPFADNGKKRTLGPKMTSLPVTKLSARAGEYLTWSGDSTQVGWFHGSRFYSRDINQALAYLADSPDELPEPEQEGIDLSFAHPSDSPDGIKALVGGKVVTMRDADNQQEVIEDGVVVFEGKRITAVGTRDEVTIPEDAQVIDVSGHTVLPGLIDGHAHGSHGRNEIIPQQNWHQFSNVAFGVTTIHDPSNDTTEVFAAADMQRAGKLISPRIYSTGTILYGAEALGFKAIVNNRDDALFHVKRMKDAGAISVKSYNQPRRDQRQQVLSAARELEMMVMPEGGGKYQQNVTMLVDGHTTLEHALPIARGYDDLTQLWSASDMAYNPTMTVAYGGMMGEEYFYDRDEVWKNPRLLRYTPSTLLDRRAIRRPKAPDGYYNHIEVAEYAKHLRDNGVRVLLGPHGQREGLSIHWEMRMLHQGGFTPWEVFRAGTYDGAKGLGMFNDLGTLEPGKLADIVVIEGDALADMSRSEYVTYTVLNGRVYEAATMNEVGSDDTRKPFFFEDDNKLFMPHATEMEIHVKAHMYHWSH